MSWDPDQWALWFAAVVFIAAGAATVLGAVRLAILGDKLADRTGLGEALFGAVLLGAATSLSGIVMTAAAALDGSPGLAYSNAVGGVAAQTAALAIADMFYRPANLEHASASLPNMFYGIIVILLLCLAAILSFAPDVTFWSIHIGSAVMIGLYLFFLRISREIGTDPMWQAIDTAETRPDVPGEDDGTPSTPRLLITFAVIACIVSAAGWAVAESAGGIMRHTGLSDTQVGTIFMGVINALPETIVAVSAIRRGALTLAVSGVLGGNAFDVLNLAVGDIAYRGGSLYHAVKQEQLMILLVALFMTTTIIAGQLRREKRGPGNIGFESVLVLLVYGSALVMIST